MACRDAATTTDQLCLRCVEQFVGSSTSRSGWAPSPGWMRLANRAARVHPAGLRFDYWRVIHNDASIHCCRCSCPEEAPGHQSSQIRPCNEGYCDEMGRRFLCCCHAIRNCYQLETHGLRAAWILEGRPKYSAGHHGSWSAAEGWLSSNHCHQSLPIHCFEHPSRCFGRCLPKYYFLRRFLARH